MVNMQQIWAVFERYSWLGRRTRQKRREARMETPYGERHLQGYCTKSAQPTATATTPTQLTKFTTAEFLPRQSKDSLCLHLELIFGALGSNYSYNWNGFQIHVASANGKVQKLVLYSLQACILQGNHYSPLARHIAEGRMYMNMRSSVYQLIKMDDVYTTVTGCVECPHNPVNKTGTPHLRLFTASSQLGFISFDIFVPLLNAIEDNQFEMINKNRCSKLTQAVPGSITRGTHTASNFSDHLISPYGIPQRC